MHIISQHGFILHNPSFYTPNHNSRSPTPNSNTINILFGFHHFASDSSINILTLMDWRYQKVKKQRAEQPIDENEIRITSKGRMRSYITYAITLLQHCWTTRCKSN